MKNDDIREHAKKSGVFLWQVAEAIGINDGNFSRKLRRELPTEERDKILNVIDRLEAQKKGAV